MAWVKLDDGFPEHPKVLAAGDSAAMLYISGLCYSNRHLTDGAIPAAALRRLTMHANAPDLAAKLVEVGLWVPTSDGWQIHNYQKYNFTAEKVQARRKANHHRIMEWRAKNNKCNAVTNDLQDALQNEPDGAAGNDTQIASHTHTHTHKLSNKPPIVPQGGTGQAQTDLGLSPPAQNEQQPAQAKTSRRQGLNASQKPFEHEALALLAELSAARLRVIQRAEPLQPVPDNLRGICDRLAAGQKPEDVRHVIAVYEAQVRAGTCDPRWFDAVTPFRPNNFAKARAMTLAQDRAEHRPRAPMLAPAIQERLDKHLADESAQPCEDDGDAA